MKRIGLLVVILLALSGCGTGGAEGRGDTAAAKGGESAAPMSPRPRPARPVWIDSLQMITARVGWALAATSNPADNSAVVVARTSDGGRTWFLVTPTFARAVLAGGQALLDGVSSQRAWVVGVTPNRQTVVFATADGGRSWSRSSSIAPGEPIAIAFAGARQGWLLESLGAAMGQNPVRLYRSSDGGRSWSLAASSAVKPGDGPSAGGLPVACDKTGVAAAQPDAGGQTGLGWITSFCPMSLADAVLVSRDGGVHWASPALPIPPSACQQTGCEVADPEFAGRTTFLVIWAYPDQALLLVTTDGGATWRTVILPAGAGPYPRVRFFSPADGIAVSAGAQGVIGRIFYLTFNGGRTWEPVAQGRQFAGSAASFDFLSPTIGFAWTRGVEPVTYRTSNSGRSWFFFVPRLGSRSAIGVSRR